MNTQTVIPAYRSGSAMHSPAGQTRTTTARAALMKQIQNLQKQEMALGEKLNALQGDDSTAAIQQRVALQQQIQRIEEQIAALQTAMLQENADRTIKVTEPAAEQQQAEPAKSDKQPVKVEVPPPVLAREPQAGDSPTSTLGRLIDVEA